MYKRMLSVVVLVFALATYMPSNASAAPKSPVPGPSPVPCSWQGQLYPDGSLRKEPFYGPNRNLLRYDFYRCANGAWIYIGSSDTP